MRKELVFDYSIDQNGSRQLQDPWISFLPEAREVSLVVYDIIGRKVNTLVDGPKKAGIHRISFDSTHLSSGVYLYRLTAGEYVETRQLTVIK